MAICKCHHLWRNSSIGHHCLSCDSDIISISVASDNMKKGTWYILGTNQTFENLSKLYENCSNIHSLSVKDCPFYELHDLQTTVYENITCSTCVEELQDRSLTKRTPDVWESVPLQAFPTPENSATSQALSTPPTRG